MRNTLKPRNKVIALMSVVALSAGMMLATTTAADAAVANVVKPRVSGKAAVGVTLTATTGAWSGTVAPPSSTQYTYQWLADGLPIAGATLPFYKLTAAELGERVSVAVTATKPPAAGVTATSRLTRPVVKGTIKPGAFYIEGINRVGHTQDVVTSGWYPLDVTITINWYADGVLTKTGIFYTPTVLEQGTKTKVVVTASAPGYNSKSLKYTRNGKVQAE